jgi:hypothetical protein
LSAEHCSGNRTVSIKEATYSERTKQDTQAGTEVETLKAEKQDAQGKNRTYFALRFQE